MNARVIWRDVAMQDLADAYLYLGERSPDAAERLMDAVDRTIELLLAHPDAGSPRPSRSDRTNGIRSHSPEGFRNYMIFYRPVGDGIDVIRILHGARDVSALLDE